MRDADSHGGQRRSDLRHLRRDIAHDDDAHPAQHDNDDDVFVVHDDNDDTVGVWGYDVPHVWGRV